MDTIMRILLLILPCILTACTITPVPAGHPDPTEKAFARTKSFQITAESESLTAGIPKNDATITAIMASKYAGGTAMAATMTAMPSETPIPAIPLDSPFCRPADLKITFKSMGATQSILLGAGLMNISKTPCFLQAWPQVVLVNQEGKPLEVDYHYFESGPSDAATAAAEQALESTTATVGVWPGWTAWLNLIWQNWCGEPVLGGAVIHLTFGNHSGRLDIPTDIQLGGACNAPGYRSTIGIGKFDPAIPPN
jgi:hypothetical protein